MKMRAVTPEMRPANVRMLVQQRSDRAGERRDGKKRIAAELAELVWRTPGHRGTRLASTTTGYLMCESAPRGSLGKPKAA